VQDLPERSLLVLGFRVRLVGLETHDAEDM
jgi:hypothetical protein